MTRYLCVLLFGMAIAACFAGVVVADPIDGRDILKFSQRPMADTFVPNPGGPDIFNGHDELSTAYDVTGDNGQLIGYSGRFMADDFADRFKSPVVHVKWWGSYLHQPTIAPLRVRRFLISFEEDVPLGDPNNELPFSHPGKPLLNQIVRMDPDGVLTPGSGTFTETLFHPISVDGPIFEYNAELHLGKDFPQDPDTVYWLKIVALVDRNPNLPDDQQIRWGWHNRDYTKHNPLASVPPGVMPGEQNQSPFAAFPIWHFQDDAVSGHVDVRFDPTNTMSFIMPDVRQSEFNDEFYVPPFDGPSIIGQFSKDLAFELYTVPEPASFLLIVLGAAAIGYV
ncbi:MAG: hypothetical protein L0228_05170, partial [Planctomycetes bacterium]|nr:hypothetical protein [Planctomycetota bacterium]